MDKKALRYAVYDLERKLKDADQMPVDLDFLYEAIKPLLVRAKNMEIMHPLDENNVPGAYQYKEGAMRDYPGLEESYAEFRIQVSGGITPQMQSILDSLKNK